MKTTVTLLCVVLTLCATAQPEKYAVLLSQREMTASGGQPYDEFYWLNSNNASLEKTNVEFPQTGTYRFDISGYLKAGTPKVELYIDGVSKGDITITSTSIQIFSLFIDEITAGTHTVKIQLSNFGAAVNHCRVGLLYFTQTALTSPKVFSTSKPTSLPSKGQYLTGDHFASKLLRGFNLSIVHTLSELTAKNIPDARATGANIGRYWISVSHLPGSTNYYYSDRAGNDIGTTSLTTLDSAIRIAEKENMYLIVTLQVFPEQAACDLWGETADAIGRRNGLKAIWQQLAARYKDKTIVAGYDLINEPRTNFNYAEYLRWQSDMIEAIRVIDPNHVIALECLRNNMYAMMLPLPYDNIIYSPHSYSPLTITHQGITTYLAMANTDVRRGYPDSATDINSLSSALSDVRTFSQRFHAPVWIGELSCVNWSPRNSQGEWTSTRWIDDDISIIEAEGWAWTYHAWREFQAWDAEIPSSYYDSYSFTNGAPFTKSNKPSNWSAARSSTAPTILMLEKWFGLNGTLATNALPNVQITSPFNNALYDTTQSIIVEVTASDIDGSIGKVEFYNEDTLLGTKLTSPYSFAISNLRSGSYSIKAKAYDNNGAISTSPLVPVTVSPVLLTILPLQLLYFDLTSLPGEQVQLNWSTKTELNTSSFDIEYFEAVSNKWKKLGEQQAAGTSRLSKTYTFITKVHEGINQFRLKQIFQNGTFVYSPIKYLNIKSNHPLFAFNPYSREIVLTSGNSSDYHVRLVDMAGHIVLNRHLTSANSKIKVPSISAGIYVVSVGDNTGHNSADKVFIR
jgi:endoglucanase